MQITKTLKHLLLAITFMLMPTLAHAQTRNICSVIKNNPNWLDHAKAASNKWNVSIGSILAFIDQESRFKANAKNGGNFGFAQATAGTWNNFLRDARYGQKTRTDFEASVHFVGWHFSQMNRQFGIGMNNVAEQYLVYQLGTGGYKRGASASSRKIAANIAARSKAYDNQIKSCGA